jgi:hypothetical protein
MQFKHLHAVGLSLLLLCVTSWAPACEVCCSLSQTCTAHNPMSSSPTARAHALGASQTHTLHSHCDQAKTARPISAVNHSLEKTSSCMKAPCGRVQTLSSPVNARDGAPSKLVRLAVVAAAPVVASENLGSSAKHERALTKFLPLYSLTVSLRI